MNDRTKHIFADRQTLIVSMAEIKELMSMEECLELQKKVFVAHVQGGAQNAPNTWLRVIGQNKWMKLLAGYVGDIDTMGMKVLARFPENPPGMNIGSLVALFDGKDGFPMAIMDAVYFTAVRTAASPNVSRTTYGSVVWGAKVALKKSRSKPPRSNTMRPIPAPRSPRGPQTMPDPTR